MSIAKCRVGDQVQGTCIWPGPTVAPFTGNIITGATKTLANGQMVSVDGAQVMTNCPTCPIVNVVVGSQTVITEGKGTTRQGDQVQGPSSAIGNVIVGSPDVQLT
jgi:uncharacterized Zn-binding protein involved in type VI secretion